MAKKKAAKKKPASKPVTLRFISDPGHGWLEVPKPMCNKLGLGTDFPSRGKHCYLEEDCDAADFDRAAKRHGVEFITAEHEVDNFEHWFGGQQWPYIPAAIYGDDSDTVRHALECLGNEMKACWLDESHTAEDRKIFGELWEDCVRLQMTFGTMNGAEKK